MIFSVTGGSKGVGDTNYTIRLPFALTDFRSIKLDDTKPFLLAGFPAHIEIEQSYYCLVVEKFPTAPDAEAFLQKLSGSIVWPLIEYGCGIQYEAQAEPAILYDEPKPLNEPNIQKVTGWQETDGHYDADKTVIVPEHLKLTRWATGSAAVKMEAHHDTFMGWLEEKIGSPTIEDVLLDERERLAYELFSAALFEEGRRPKFLTLVTVLEALSPETEASSEITTIVDALLEKFPEEVESIDADTKAKLQPEINSLGGRLRDLKKKSIRQNMQQLVSEKLASDLSEEELGTLKQDVDEIYKIRSSLVHDGSVDSTKLDWALTKANDIVKDVLKATFLKAAGEQ